MARAPGTVVATHRRDDTPTVYDLSLPRLHLAEGDIVHVDVTAESNRFRSGTSATFVIDDVSLGSPKIRELADGWTIVTADGRWTAQFEHTVLVTRGGHEVLTR
jgi:methionyl aminopeptidase